MDDKDAACGRVLSRRRAIAMLGSIGGAILLRSGSVDAQPDPQPLACVARPQQTEGPYFVDTKLERSDIRPDPVTGKVEPGVTLKLAFRVARLDRQACAPLRDALVELWQCNASGVYSGVRDPAVDATELRFLRGFQRTDSSGLARFTTIYPGWYPGRTVHLHFSIRTERGTRHDQLTSQLYFDDRLTDQVFARAPYADRGARTVRNAADGIYRRGGEQLMLAVKPQGNALSAAIDIALQA
jgi:protocatechuate 3,4-dioxygenase beta subunit